MLDEPARALKARAAGLVAVALACGLAVGAVPPGETPHADAVDLAREIAADERFQSRMPGADPPPEVPSWLASIGPLAKWALWGIALASAVALVVWLGGRVGWWRRRAALRPEPASAGSEVRGSEEESIEDARLLAGEGRYGEAAHALLLAAIRRISRARRVAPSRACTSRELRRVLPLDAAARDAFGELVLAVEGAYFGGLALDRAGYERCVSLYRAATGRPAR